MSSLEQGAEMNIRMMKRSLPRSSGAIAAISLAAAISGCSYIEQAQDNAPMISVLEVKRAQTLNPAAGANRKAVAGLNGQAAQNVSDTYAKSFAPKAGGTPNAMFLGLGGVGGGE